MRRKTIIVTGANSGLGRATAEGLSKQGARVIMACRDPEKGEAARAEILAAHPAGEVELRPLDLASFASIRAFSEQFRADHETIDVLINNAATLPRGEILTVDGFEAQFGVNHLGHFLLTSLLIEPLMCREGGRIVALTSLMHAFGEIQPERFHGWGDAYHSNGAYAQSKLATLLFCQEFARRVDPQLVTANAIHPGLVKTNIMRNSSTFYRWIAKLVFASPERGARGILHLATSAAVRGVSGEYFVGERRKRAAKTARDPALAARLWDQSATLCGAAPA